MSAKHVALVTGGAGGIGLATVRRLASRGVAVVIADLNAEIGGRVAASVQAEASVSFVRLDVTERKSWAAAVDFANQSHGPVDILVNCAGILRDRSLSKMTDMDWD